MDDVVRVLYLPSLLGGAISGLGTLVCAEFERASNAEFKEDGWHLAWRIYRNTLLGSVWYVSIPLIQLYRLCAKRRAKVLKIM